MNCRLHPIIKRAVLSFATVAGFSALSAADKVALVIGNGAYKNAPVLENPVNDARAVSKLLETLGFEVISVEDAGIEEIHSGLVSFKRIAENARVGLFYFAGHGMEVEKTNYLLPIDAELDREAQLRTQAVGLDLVLRDMESTRLPAKLLILDCCRDNPLTRSWLSSRSSTAGLAGIPDADLPEATMILFSAGPGQVALDGTGDNSPFTKALVNELGRPGRNAMDAFLAVSDSVVAETRQRQEPWVKVDGAGRAFRMFGFAPEAAVVSPVPAPSQPSVMSSAVPGSIGPVGVPGPARPSDLKPSSRSIRIVPDHHATLKEAFDAVQSGETIFIRSGIHECHEALVLEGKSNVEIRGEGFETTILRDKVPAAHLLEIRNGEGIRISNLSLEYTGTPEKSSFSLLHIRSKSTEVRDCILHGNNAVYAIFAEGADTTISGCQVKSSPFGIYIGGGTSLVKSNEVTRCTQGIVFRAGTNSTAEDNTAEDNEVAGIGVDSDGNSVVIRGNTCRRNSVGVLFNSLNATGNPDAAKGAEGSVIGNLCEENSSHGIQSGDNSLLIQDNRCHRNGGQGILVTGAQSKPSIVGNVCNNNEQVGIAVESVCYPAKFEGNSGSGNKRGDILRNARF